MQEEVLLTSTTTNPFAVDRVTDPFGAQAIDVADFNQKAFASIAQEIRFVRESRHCRGVLVLGEAGSGKTHLLGRIHAQLAAENHLLFVPRPTNPSMKTEIEISEGPAS